MYYVLDRLVYFKEAVPLVVVFSLSCDQPEAFQDIDDIIDSSALDACGCV